MRDEEAILRILSDENPWWARGSGKRTSVPQYRRRDFHILKRNLTGSRIIAVGGPRQVGKTTLLYQLIEEMLTSVEFDPRRVLYLAMDFPRLAQVTDEPLTDALDVYAERIIARPWRDLESTSYVFLDEVTKLRDWHRVLKGWFDRRLPLKFVVSDSSLPSLHKGIAESLIGRCDLFVVLPMKFVDVLMFHEGREEINDASLRLRSSFQESVRKGSPTTFLTACRAAAGRLAPMERRILAHLQSYIFTDGYPELLTTPGGATATRRLREYLDLIFARDLVQVFDIRNPRALSALVAFLADRTADRFDYTGLAKNVGLSPDATREYLDYLESSFVVLRSEFYTKSRASRLRKQKKLYFGNVGLANALTGNVGPQLFENREYLGRLIETLVADHSKRLLYSLHPEKDSTLFYWRNYRGQEVDMVLNVDGRPIPLEVKYQPRITNADRRPVLDFLSEEKKAPFGIIVTRETLGIDGDIVSVPLHLFLLMA